MSASQDTVAVHQALQAANCGAARFDGTNVELTLDRPNGSKSRFSLVYASPSDYPTTPLLIVPDDPTLSAAAEVRMHVANVHIAHLSVGAGGQ